MSAGTVTKIPGNDKGVWVVGNARTEGSFSATVQLHTATATATGACAYASNYPPVGNYTSTTEISFTGTLPYEIVLKDSEGATVTRESGKLFSVPASYTVQSFSDKTGAPGIVGYCHLPGVTGITFAAFNPCNGAPYGSTYTLTDDRDNKTYKVKYMPDDRYWMVQDLAFGDKCALKTTTSASSGLGNVNSSGTYYGDCRKNSTATGGFYYNRYATMNSTTPAEDQCTGTDSGFAAHAPNTCRGICPVGWHVPTEAEILDAEKKVNASSLCSSGCWNSPSAWEGVVQGWSQSSSMYYTTEILYNSSTYNRVIVIRTPYTQGSFAAGADEQGRSFIIRCVKNY